MKTKRKSVHSVTLKSKRNSKGSAVNASMIKMNMKTKTEEFVELYLENGTFEELLEEFDLTPIEVFVVLLENGLIDEELLERFY